MRRLSKERNAIKKAASIVVPDKYKAILISSQEINEYILSTEYIFPKAINVRTIYLIISVGVAHDSSYSRVPGILNTIIQSLLNIPPFFK